MDQLIQSFNDFLVSERNYSKHTVKAYITDIGEFCRVIKEKNLASDKESGIDFKAGREASQSVHELAIYEELENIRFEKAGIGKNILRILSQEGRSQK